MGPILTASSPIDRALANPDFLCQRPRIFGTGADVKDLFFGKFAGRVPFSDIAIGMEPSAVRVSFGRSSLLDPICDVVSRGSDPQVIDIHTEGRVASVADVHSFRNVFIRSEHPGHPVNRELFPGDVDCTVSASVLGTLPKPTLGGGPASDSTPEPFGYTLSFSHVAPPCDVVRGRRRDSSPALLPGLYTRRVT